MILILILSIDISIELDKDFLVAVNKFHVYAHQFSCQVKHHPHCLPDTDGEGIERYWSKAAFLVRRHRRFIIIIVSMLTLSTLRAR
ncbi:hypothetical protein V1517DRAFT_172241 [Lipomyces orientalis]|uniref:Uncharacterized protein n=1 Tax=Lipomyces orientalis TaxID=1233043 RepID=A0ACC3TK61_9ASCO